MKISFFPLPLLASILSLSSCKKDSKDQAPVPPAATVTEQLNPANGKLTHYLFNGNIRDTSGNNYHGGEANDLAYSVDRFNRPDRALQFNGTSTVFQTQGMHLSFPFSISLWVNTPDPSATATLFQSDRNSSSYYGCWLQTSVVSAGKLAFSFGNGTGTSSAARNSLLSTVTLSGNQWHHLVINVRGADDMDLYIDGARDNNAVYDGSATSMNYSHDNPSGVIGRGFSSQYFTGRIDDFRVYNRVLSPTEVNSLYTFQP